MSAELSEPRQDAWLWRLCATGMAFSLFGLGGLVLRFIVFPPMRLLGGDAALRRCRSRAAITWSFRCFIRFMVRVGILTVDFRGAERLGRPGQMIIANHPSLLDVVFLIGHVAGASCIVRHGLVENVFTRGPITAAGYISNNESTDMLDQAAAALREGDTLIVFPEGTRTPRDSLPRFHRGACAIAMRGARIITPVVIRMSPRSLTKGEPWYRIPRRRMQYSIQVGEDIDPADWTSRHPLPIAGRRMNDHLHAYFERELARQ
ncbi:lysophospholipid acyltransferase family protein [Pseudothauera rhizosphaerae]|uniref:1-acyl-sn-glycerol-3-phosphate acyltransferase n=1 Tax=Pseudothauera rhizosphaerae TaxID=2565932 RepID=A0A4S4AVE2_9RHOO|nr:lysophospholipid acyltransferase family protein [Pseudothauera rhizosphaerae]THF62506.1 1-acyl-sn-glycerol-3-phosphate acyltransferase [Pseudothauera rhizosphaerae]